MKLKIAAWVAVAAVSTLVVLTIVAAAGSRTEPLRKLVIATLEDRLDSSVELKAFSVDLFPAVTVSGSGLTLRLRTVADPAVPPLIQIDSFTVHCGIVDLLRRPRRFKHVTLEGLVVNIPPGGLKKDGNPIADESQRSGPGREVARSREQRTRSCCSRSTGRTFLRSSSIRWSPTALSSESFRGAKASSRKSSPSTS